MNKVKDLFKLKIIRWLLIAALAMMALALLGYMTILYGGKLIVQEEDFYLPAATTIETIDGQIVGELFEERRYPVTIDEIPEQVQNAFIAIEDRRFYSHSGIDFRSVVRALYRDIIARDKVEGASTITQQLAKNLFLEHDKTWMRKTKEVMAAIYLERKFSKKEILELYVNKIYFGKGLHGIEAASRQFFSKSVQDLSISESAMLAGLVQAPNYYYPEKHPERALNRRNVVLRAMERAGMINTEKRLEEESKDLQLSPQEGLKQPWNASYIDLVVKEVKEHLQISTEQLKRGGYRILVPLEEDIQKIVYEKFKEDEYFPGNTDQVEGAFVMIDQKTGRILSALGGRDYSLGNLNRVGVKRQPGSAIKPLIVYGPAMMTEGYHPYMMLPDEAIDYDGYVVSNVDGHYSGIVSMYDALVQSKNAPTVWLLNEIGVKESKNYLEKMQIHLVDEDLPLALGGLTEGMTPLDMVKGFSAFANDGKSVEPYAVERIFGRDNQLVYDAKIVQYEVFTPQVAWYMTEILQEAVKSGTARSGEYKKALAGKTGTTDHPRAPGYIKDIWFVGYTPEYVTSLWIGNDISDEDHYLTGNSSYPTKLTKDILSEIDRELALSEQFIKPDYVQALPEPIRLREVENVKVSYTFGGFPFLKGKISWASDNESRVVYRIYEENEEGVKLIGEAAGNSREYIIDQVPLLKSAYYFVVPYDPNTNQEGTPSETVRLSL